LRNYSPPILVVWEMGDLVFLSAGAEAYRREMLGRIAAFLARRTEGAP